MFEGFRLETIDTGEATLRVRYGGSGPPLLLLHGHPQTHVMWHRVAPLLARDFTVVAPDLRCYLNPATVHATCEDYRAGATYDFALDEADRSAGHRIACPVLALWAAHGSLSTWYDGLKIWRDWADDVR